MATSGKNTRVYKDGYDLSGYFREATIKLTGKTSDATPFGKDDEEFIGGLKGGSISMGGFFDGAADAVDEALRDALAESGLLACFVGPNVGDLGYAMNEIESNYEVKSPVDGVVSTAVDFVSKIMTDRVISLHTAVAFETAGANGTTVDNSAPTTNGGSGHIHCVAITGTPTLTVTLRHSTDNFVGDDTLLGTFAVIIAAKTAERIALAGTIKQYVRAVWTLSGGTAKFVVALGRA